MSALVIKSSCQDFAEQNNKQGIEHDNDQNDKNGKKEKTIL